MAQQPLRRKRLVGDRCYQLFWGAATEVHLIPTPRKQKMSSAASVSGAEVNRDFKKRLRKGLAR